MNPENRVSIDEAVTTLERISKKCKDSEFYCTNQQASLTDEDDGSDSSTLRKQKPLAPSMKRKLHLTDPEPSTAHTTA